MKKLISALVLSAISLSAAAQETSGVDLIKRGEYLARVGDCVA